MSRLRVLQSNTPDRGDISVNPYTVLLDRSLAAHCEVHRFTWPYALSGRYDVLHCHWPEHLIGNAQWLRRTVAQMLFAVLLVVLRVRRVAVVKTMHNVTPHGSPSRISDWLLTRLDGAVDVRIYLHAPAAADHRSPGRVFPHGDYRGWFADVPRAESVSGRLAYFGRVHAYKNVDGLLRAFADVADDSLRLEVAGTVTDPSLRAEIERLGAADPRVHLSLRALTDEELVGVLTGAEAVVLPYGYLYNSGVLVLALSLGRPVIVPKSVLADEMAAEVGEQWVARYDQPLDAAGLTAALAALRERAADRAVAPVFAGRDWDGQAARLVELYRATVAARRG